MPLGITGCSGETYITKRRGEMGEPWGVPTATSEKILGEPWKSSLHMRLVRKLPTHAVRFLWAPLARSADVSWPGLTVSKPPLMSRKRDETLCNNPTLVWLVMRQVTNYLSIFC